VVFEESVRGAESFRKQSPQPASAHFRARAIEAFDRPFRVFTGRFAHGLVDSHPITDGCHFAEWHAGLHHAEGAGIHSQKHHSFFSSGIAFQIALMGLPCVFERPVNAGRRCGEIQILERLAETEGGCDQFIRDTHGRTFQAIASTNSAAGR
jgi:hypothetical protein